MLDRGMHGWMEKECQPFVVEYKETGKAYLFLLWQGKGRKGRCEEVRRWNSKHYNPVFTSNSSWLQLRTFTVDTLHGSWRWMESRGRARCSPLQSRFLTQWPFQEAP